MEFTAQQIADFLNGDIVGDPSVKVSDFAKIEEACPGTLTFLANPKYTHYAYESKASIILVNKDFKPETTINATLIKVDNAYESLAKLLELKELQKTRRSGISELAYIAPTAQIGENVYIAPFVYVSENAIIANNASIDAHSYIGEKAKIGENTQLHSGVKIEHECEIGNNCIIHSGTVIGADGFGFAPTEDGSYKKIMQVGNVVIEDDVEIGANVTIDRATMGSTFIRKGVKIDNLVQIAHNVEVGEHTAIAGQSGIAGSTKVGKHCIMAGQVGIAGHLEIADHCIFGAQTGVANSIKAPKSIMQGYPAIPVGTFRRASVVYKNLPDLQRQITEMQRQLDELKSKNVQ